MDSNPSLELQVRHASPGRLRFRVEKKCLNSPTLQQAEATLAQLTGVNDVRRNNLAKSIVVSYDPQLVDVADVFAALTRDGAPLTIRAGEIPSSTDGRGLDRAVSAVAQKADRRVVTMTRGATDLGTLIPISLAVLGAREILAGRLISVPWYLFFWYSIDTFFKFRKPSATSKPSGHDG